MKNFIVVFVILVSVTLNAQEELFATYFDIKTNEKSGKEVFGKINLKRNKDVHKKTIPSSYNFKIEKSSSDLFEISSEFDVEGRFFGVLKVAKGEKTDKSPKDYKLSISLNDNNTIIETFEITVHVVEVTMWENLMKVYAPVTIETSRLFGRKKYSDKKLEGVLDEVEKNNGRFLGLKVYDTHPSEYKSPKEIDKDWEEATARIGALGYSYATSKNFGIKSNNSKNTERLKKAIYSTVIEYTSAIPIKGEELLEGGKPVGNELGDGFSKNHYLSHGFLTHQWRAIDALGAPLVHVWPEVLNDIEQGDEQAQLLYDAVIRYYQLFFSIVPQRREMDNISQRWKNISDSNYSEGAWADANISHRMRTLMVMPILWADYNKPITYVPYWYDDYYNGTKFEGLTFPKNWTPTGVVEDVRSWCDKLSVPSHIFNQSGFHPDGTVTHHSGHNASDVAMYAYGYEWLTTINSAIYYFKDTPYPVKDESYQFLADRLNYTYRRMIYKNSLDFVVAGRSFYGELSDFGSKHVSKTISQLVEGKSPTTKIENEDELLQLKASFKKENHMHTETTSFWVADYLVHRKEDKKNNYYFSVKHKSVRTSGAEDFTKVRKSWHAGSGVFLLRVDGDEYGSNNLSKADWHVLPGVTEAWEIDPMPKGPASSSLPGGNEFSGILADGSNGLAGYHHKPIDTYTSAEALKSTHLVKNFGTAIGSAIQRKKTSEKSAPIVTCIDQAELKANLTYAINNEVFTIKAGENKRLEIEISEPVWMHHKNKGYLIFPKLKQQLLITTGDKINVTETTIKNNKSLNYIIALNHGVNPDVTNSGYHYVQVANVSADEMPKLLESYVNNTEILVTPKSYHAMSLKNENLKQVVFYESGTVDFKNYTISTNKPSLIIVKDMGKQVQLSFSDPLHSLDSSEVTIQISEQLKEGTYTYNFPGIKEKIGETAIVKSNNEGATITISLPDRKDGLFYNYQEQMYAGAPIVLTLKKASSL